MSSRHGPSWEEIEQRMAAAKAVLIKSGAVRPKHRPGGTVQYVIRYREKAPDGRQVQRSIPLGTDEGVVQKARVLLASWQEHHDPRRSLHPGVREMWKILGECEIYVPPRLQETFRRHHRQAGTDVQAIFAANATWPVWVASRLFRRRKGRPPKGGLRWLGLPGKTISSVEHLSAISHEWRAVQAGLKTRAQEEGWSAEQYAEAQESERKRMYNKMMGRETALAGAGPAGEGVPGQRQALEPGEWDQGKGTTRHTQGHAPTE